MSIISKVRTVLKHALEVGEPNKHRSGAEKRKRRERREARAKNGRFKKR